MHGRLLSTGYLPKQAERAASRVMEQSLLLPLPSLFTERSPQTKIAVKEQAGFHFAAGGVCVVFSIERSFRSVKERLGSSCFGVSALRGISL